MKRLFKAGLVAVTLMWGSAVWAQQCGSGFMDAQGNCHNTNMGTVPMGTQGIDTGSSSNGGGGNSAPPQVIYRKLPDSYGAIAFSPSGAVGTASKQASKQARIPHCEIVVRADAVFQRYIGIPAWLLHGVLFRAVVEALCQLLHEPTYDQRSNRH